MSDYKDPIFQEIVGLIDADNTTINKYYYGDPLIIARSDLPALIISKNRTVNRDENMAEDEHKIECVITIVTDIRDDFGAGSGIVAGWSTLYDIVEGRNSSNYELKNSAVLDILKRSANLSHNAQIDVDTPITADYGLAVGKRGERAISVEANIFFTVFFDQLRDTT